MQENREKRAYWLQHVEALRHSGLTRKDYCEKYQLNLSTFTYWCRKLDPAGGQCVKIRETGWIPVQISEEDASGIDLRIGRINIAVKSGFDPLLLADVLRTINALC